MSWVALKNRLFELRARHRFGFAAGFVVTGAFLGATFGLTAEALFLGGVLGWLGWDSRPRLFLSLGLFEKAARVAGALADEAGPSLRGDLLRLTEATARLNLGQLAEAKHALREVEPRRLPARSRLLHLLNSSTLYARLGDGETALAMVEAAEAEVETMPEAWHLYPALNRSLALFELGRYDDAAACLRALDPETLSPRARAYVFNNLAWAVALGGGDIDEALGYAEKAVRLRRSDPYCRGTLGFCMVLAGGAAETAVGYMRRSLARGKGRSPAGRALVMAACAQALRALGKGKQARELEADLAALPGGHRHLGRFRAALAAGGMPLLAELPQGA